MRIVPTLIKKNAQTAVEYMLLLAAVVAIVLIGFKHYVPGFTQAANIYFNRTSGGIMGKPNKCGDGKCHRVFENCEKCPVDCSCDP